MYYIIISYLGVFPILPGTPNESNPDFEYRETVAILRVTIGDLGFGPKCMRKYQISKKFKILK